MKKLWVKAYQELLELEKQKIDKYGLNDPPNKLSFINNEDIMSVCQKHGIDPQSFSSELMIQYPGFGWRTMHFDLIYRLVNIRNIERQVPIPLEFKLDLQSEPVPDFDSHKFSEVLPKLIQDEKVRRVIDSALSNTKYKGLSSYQLPIIEELLVKRTHKTAAIVAPTASGKTFTFFLPVIVKATQKATEGKKGVSSILIYPRKALERDQLQNFISIVDAINQSGNRVTIGVDDGDTKWLQDIQNGDSYREIKCIKCLNNLIINKKGSKTLVKCSGCSKEYAYILASKNEIWEENPSILITNIYTIYRRLLTSSTVKMFAGIDYIVFDEAHVYTDYLGGHVSYIIRFLRHAARSSKSDPYLVFSSATISNPKDFISQLAACQPSDIFYLDYKKTLEKVEGIERRLMLNLYLLPHPNSSVETLTEALILAVTLWCHRRNLKAITFVDSVAEISTLTDYIHTIILGQRFGGEVKDHIFATKNLVENSYNWSTISPPDKAKDEQTFGSFILNDYKNSIDIHYGQLSLQERAKVESEFSKGIKRMLLSTSTLELGIDLSDVAAIIQHKLPMTPESFVQRVGRSGRSDTCYRVALGILALNTLPLSTLYMFDKNLRDRLADPTQLPPARVGQASSSIKLQHTLSLVLYKRALEGKPTYIQRGELLKTEQEVVSGLQEIINELNDSEALIYLNDSIGLFDRNTLIDQITTLKSTLSTIVNYSRKPMFQQSMQDWQERLNEFENTVSIIKETLEKIEKAKKIFEKIQTQNLKDILINNLNELESLLRQGYILCYKLLTVAKSSFHAGDQGMLQNWYKSHSSDLINLANRTPDSSFIKSRVLDPVLKYLNRINNDYLKFKQTFGCEFDDVINVLSDVTKSFNINEGDLVNFFKQLPAKANYLQSVNLSGLIASQGFSLIKEQLNIKNSIDIIDAINLALLNKMRFSLMLEPPSPELVVEGVEEA